MIIGTRKFSGMIPKVEGTLLGDEFAGAALSVKLQSGALLPFNGATPVAGVTVDGGATSLWRNPANDLWQDFTHDTDVVRNPLANDAWDRVYWTDSDPTTLPKMAANGVFASGFLLGIPAVSGATAASVNGAPGTDALLAETRAYVTTYVSAYSEEGPPSNLSNLLTVYPSEGNTVTVTIPSAPTGNHNISAVNIYRLNSGSSGAEFQRVAQVPVGSAPYLDSVESDNLGIILPSEDWVAPPDGLQGLCAHPAGFLAGFSGSELCLSVRLVPHAWPYAHRYALDGNIVSIGVFGSSLLVTTNRATYLVTGADPAAMTVERLEVGGACVSKRGTVDMGSVVLYPTTEGLVGVGVGTAPTLLTAGVIDRDTWASYKPQSMISAQFGDRYLCVCGVGSSISGFVFDLTTKDFMPITIGANALFYDPSDGILYTHTFGSTAIVAFDADTANPLSYSWRSKQYRLARPTSFAVGQVFSDSYPLTLKLYTDAVAPFATVSVGSSDSFRLPGGSLYDSFAYKISCSSKVTAAMFANSVAELRGV